MTGNIESMRLLGHALQGEGSFAPEIPARGDFLLASASVMAGQCARSNGGLWYENHEEFHRRLDWLLNNNALARRIGLQGKDYVTRHYGWEAVEQKYISFLDKFVQRL